MLQGEIIALGAKKHLKKKNINPPCGKNEKKNVMLNAGGTNSYH